MPKNSKKKKSRCAEDIIENFVEDRYEVRLSGSGGQGLITAGVILAEAIAVGDGKNSAQTQSYGPEARGGRTRCDVIVSEGEIFFPEAIELDLLLALTQEACDAYIPLLKPDGILILDTEEVKNKPDREYVGVPFTEETKSELGNVIATNVVCLGFISGFVKTVSRKSLETSVLNNFDERFAENNLNALKLGYKLAKKASKASCSGEPSEECMETEIDRL